MTIARASACLLTTSLALAVGLGVGLVRPTVAHAQRPGAQVEYVPNDEIPQGVEVQERLGAKVDLDAPMLDHDGRPQTLRGLMGDKPVLLTFNYSSCPGLCSVHLNRLVEALGNGRLAPGKTFRLVTIVLAPEETAARAGRTRQQYLAKLDHLGAAAVDASGRAGWTFLVADPAGGEAGAGSIRAIADSVGFGYRKVDGQYAHPAAIIAVATDGTVTRYVHGLELTSDDLATTVVKAGMAEPSTAVGYVLACFHLAPRSHNALVARQVLRFVALAFVAALLGIGAFLLTRRHRKPSGVMPS